MKAITLWQPWASLVAIGAKRIETRSWPISYRGPLAIHAGVRREWDAQLETVQYDPFQSALNRASQHRNSHLPRAASAWMTQVDPSTSLLGTFPASNYTRDCL